MLNLFDLSAWLSWPLDLIVLSISVAIGFSEECILFANHLSNEIKFMFFHENLYHQNFYSKKYEGF